MPTPALNKSSVCSSRRGACQWLLAALLLVSACSPMVEQRGHMRIAESIPKIQKGSSRDDVLALLGTPSSYSSFGPETWYYISQRKETMGFMRPKTVEQEVLALHFDEGGEVQEVEHYGLQDGVKVAVTKDVTPTEGHSMGVMEQLLGNFGKFNKSQQPKD